MLGGTKFVGRAFVDSALRRGHRVTLFNRGTTNPDLFGDEVEKLRGDRTVDLSALAGRKWDAVVDVAGYYPEDVARSAQALAGTTGRYLFVSTISVYADHTVPPVEGAPLAPLTDPADRGPETYGARKAVCEQLVAGAFGDGATIVRPGLIVGPFDPTDRFGYWPRRVAAGGRVLAPGDPEDPLQFIDVRDLADFMALLLEDDRPGTYNAVGLTLGFAKFLDGCQKVCAEVHEQEGHKQEGHKQEGHEQEVEVVWVPDAVLLQAGIDPWMGIPLWIGAPEYRAANRVNVDRALAAGLHYRPLEDTIRASFDSPLPSVLSSFTAERERDLLEAFMGQGRQ